MSKRPSSSQLTGSTQDRGDPFAQQSSMQDDDPVKQLSASERAKRRIIKPRSRKFGGSSQQNSQMFPNPFASVDNNQVNGTNPNGASQSGFSFGSASSFPPTNTPAFGQTNPSSASFPVPQSGGSGAFSFGSTTPASGFSFNVEGRNNPFSGVNGTPANPPSPYGAVAPQFAGSIFNTDPPPQQQPTANGFGATTTSMFPQSNTFGVSNDDGMQISPQASPAKKGGLEAGRANVFGAVNSTPFQSTNLFGQTQPANVSVSQQSLFITSRKKAMRNGLQNGAMPPFGVGRVAHHNITTTQQGSLFSESGTFHYSNPLIQAHVLGSLSDDWPPLRMGQNQSNTLTSSRKRKRGDQHNPSPQKTSAQHGRLIQPRSTSLHAPIIYTCTNFLPSGALQNSPVSQPTQNAARPNIFGQPQASTSASPPTFGSLTPSTSEAQSTQAKPFKPFGEAFPTSNAATDATSQRQLSPSPAPFNPFQPSPTPPAAEGSRSPSPFQAAPTTTPNFGNTFQPTPTEVQSFKPSGTTTAPANPFQLAPFSPAPSKNLFGAIKTSSEQASPVKTPTPASTVATLPQPDTSSIKNPPSTLSRDQQAVFTQQLDLRSLNTSFRSHISRCPIEADWSRICLSYVQQYNNIINGPPSHQSTATGSTKRKASDQLPGDSAKRSRASDPTSDGGTTGSPSKSASHTSNLFKSIVDSSEQSQSPTLQGSPTKTQSTAQPTTKSPFAGFNSANASPSKPPAFNLFPDANSANQQSSLFVQQPAAPSPFTFKPSANGNSSSEESVSKIKPPTFAVAGSTNFMAQFGKRAEEEAKKKKQERKDEDFDSDEDDDASWDEKDEERQRKKKEELEALAKSNSLKFVPGKGFEFAKAKDTATSNAVAPESQQSNSGSNVSVFSTQTNNSLKVPASNNIFAHLSDAESGAEGSKAGDADDEDTDPSDDNDQPPSKSPSKKLNGPADKTQRAEESDDGESLEDAIRRTAGRSPKKPVSEQSSTNGAGRSLFDRITPAGTPAERSQNVSDNETGGKQSPFGNAGRSNGTSLFSQPFSQSGTSPASSLFGIKPKSPAGDHTWKPESPIKFGGAATSAPTFNITPATPSKSNTTPFSGLFGASPDKPSSSLFNLGSTTPTSSPAKPASEVGFSFGGPPKTNSQASSTLFPFNQNSSVFNSAASSRATSPGGDTSAAESTDGGETETAAEPQVDLTLLTEAEKLANDVLFEALSVKFLQFDNTSDKKWEARGVGPLRILKNRESGVVTILGRASPSGKIVLNNRTLKDVEYKRVQKGTTRITVSEKNGLGTWMIRCGTDEVADRLATVLMENRPE